MTQSTTRMKKIMRTTFIALITTIIIVVAMSIVEYSATHYDRQGVVIKVNNNSKEIYIQDSTGNVWICTNKTLYVGQRVVMTMNTKHTDNYINDDSIERVKVIKK